MQGCFWELQQVREVSGPRGWAILVNYQLSSSSPKWEHSRNSPMWCRITLVQNLPGLCVCRQSGFSFSGMSVRLFDSKALGIEQGWGRGKVWTTQQKKAHFLWRWDTHYFSGRCGLSSQFSRLTSSLNCAKVPGLTLTWLLLPKPWSPHLPHLDLARCLMKKMVTSHKQQISTTCWHPQKKIKNLFLNLSWGQELQL